MTTLLHGNAFCFTAALWGESISYRSDLSVSVDNHCFFYITLAVLDFVRRVLTCYIPVRHTLGFPWWRHDMETFSILLTFCEENLLVTGWHPHHPFQRDSDMDYWNFFAIGLKHFWTNKPVTANLIRHDASLTTPLELLFFTFSSADLRVESSIQEASSIICLKAVLKSWPIVVTCINVKTEEDVCSRSRAGRSNYIHCICRM